MNKNIIDKYIMVYSHKGILHSNKKKMTIDISSNMDGKVAIENFQNNGNILHLDLSGRCLCFAKIIHLKSTHLTLCKILT